MVAAVVALVCVAVRAFPLGVRDGHAGAGGRSSAVAHHLGARCSLTTYRAAGAPDLRPSPAGRTGPEHPGQPRELGGMWAPGGAGIALGAAGRRRHLLGVAAMGLAHTIGAPRYHCWFSPWRGCASPLATGWGMGLLRPVVEAVPDWACATDEVGGAGDARLCGGGRRGGPTLRQWSAVGRPAIGAICAILVLVGRTSRGGAWGRCHPVRYPPGWAAVAATVNADPQPVAR